MQTATCEPTKKVMDEIRDANLSLISSTSRLLAEADKVRVVRDRLLSLVAHMDDHQQQGGQR